MAAGRLPGSITSTSARLLALVDARPGRQGRRTARLQRQHAHAGLVERTRQLPDGLLEQPPVAHLDHEIGTHLGEQALDRAVGAPQDAIALRAATTTKSSAFAGSVLSAARSRKMVSSVM